MMAAPDGMGSAVRGAVAALHTESVEVGRKNLLSRSSTS